MKTTIQLDKQTISRLQEHKLYPREPYDAIVNRLIDEAEDDEELTPDEIKDIEVALEQVKQGKTIRIEDLAKELGVKL